MVTPPVLPIRKPYDCRRDKNNNTSKSVGENVEEHTLVITMKIMTEMEMALALAIEMKILKNIYQWCSSELRLQASLPEWVQWVVAIGH